MIGRIPSNPPPWLSHPPPPNKPPPSPPQQQRIRIKKMGLIPHPPCLLSHEAADKLFILLPPSLYYNLMYAYSLVLFTYIILKF
jgi:hypothetical protein